MQYIMLITSILSFVLSCYFLVLIKKTIHLMSEPVSIDDEVKRLRSSLEELDKIIGSSSK